MGNEFNPQKMQTDGMQFGNSGKAVTMRIPGIGEFAVIATTETAVIELFTRLMPVGAEIDLGRVQDVVVFSAKHIST